MSLIKLTKINKTYDEGTSSATPVLRNVNLTINEGEFVAIMGSSGSGKTTLMNIIGLLDKASRGTYLLNGQNTGKLKDKQLAELRRQAIGFVFQSFNLLPRMSTRANVELPMLYNKMRRRSRKEWALKLLRVVGLSEKAKAKPTELSGGQLQRVAIARSLANRPSLILADEPTGNLDSRTGAVVMNIFRKLHSKGNTIIVVTHDEHIAEQASRIIHIKDGKIVPLGKRAKKAAVKPKAGRKTL